MHDTFEGERGGDFCLAKAGLAEGTNANTIRINTPDAEGVHYCIGGILYHKADTDNIVMNALPLQAALTSCLYVVQINAAGTVTMKKGREVPTAALTGGTDVLDWPQPDNNQIALGYLRIALANAATFTNGSTDLGATDVVDTFFDVFRTPARPLTS